MKLSRVAQKMIYLLQSSADAIMTGLPLKVETRLFGGNAHLRQKSILGSKPGPNPFATLALISSWIGFAH
jgi:hypothetical protein